MQECAWWKKTFIELASDCKVNCHQPLELFLRSYANRLRIFALSPWHRNKWALCSCNSCNDITLTRQRCISKVEPVRYKMVKWVYVQHPESNQSWLHCICHEKEIKKSPLTNTKMIFMTDLCGICAGWPNVTSEISHEIVGTWELAMKHNVQSPHHHHHRHTRLASFFRFGLDLTWLPCHLSYVSSSLKLRWCASGYCSSQWQLESCKQSAEGGCKAVMAPLFQSFTRTFFFTEKIWHLVVQVMVTHVHTSIKGKHQKNSSVLLSTKNVPVCAFHAHFFL